MIYLACPYSHPDLQIRELRYTQACRTAGILISKGLLVFSPISHGHPIATHCSDMPLSWDYWKKFNLTMLRNCSSLCILAIDGWNQSVGVKAEWEAAREWGMHRCFISQEGTVLYFTPDEIKWSATV